MIQMTPSLNLTICDREPIRIPGAIQPHGALIAASSETELISHVSENASAILGRPIDSIVGHDLASVFDESLRQAVNRWRRESRAPHSTLVRLGTFTLSDGCLYDMLAHEHQGTLFVEFEAVASGKDIDNEWLSGRMLNFVAELETARAFGPLCGLLARQVRELIAFDRVLIYQFDRDWNGVVVCEDRNDRLPSYLDLRFPASDIPVQARELYRINRSRLISRADYSPISIVTNLSDAPALDLTFATLRSVSPVHLEYMRNMGTAASISFSIMRGSELWGLIACHHAEPRQVRFDVRRSCDLIARTFSLQVDAIAQRESAELRVTLNDARTDLLRGLARAPSLEAGIVDHGEALLACTRATGVALASSDRVTAYGVTPDESIIRSLATWLSTRGDDTVFATHALGKDFPLPPDAESVASGMLAVRISQFQKSSLIWFRPELAQTVTWAGDPRKAATAGAYEDRLHPRRSFEAWKQIVRGLATPWESADRDAALALRTDIIAIILRKAEALAAVNQELERSNKELEAFSYSVSHDLRAPFRHIVGYSELLSEFEAPALSERGQRYIQTVIEAARTAGKLIDNLLLFSRMGRSGLSLMKIDMTRLFDEVRQDVVKSEAADRKIEWTISDLPPAWADPNMLRLAVRNLVSNAVKYSRDREVARIDITGRTIDDGAEYCIRDDGVGFDMAYVDKLFGVFQRLHSIEQFEGTGIGLANVQRIVTRHGGRVWGEGAVGQGATFHFWLPNRPAAPDAEHA